jgi:hypothetical protein
MGRRRRRSYRKQNFPFFQRRITRILKVSVSLHIPQTLTQVKQPAKMTTQQNTHQNLLEQTLFLLLFLSTT